MKRLFLCLGAGVVTATQAMGQATSIQVLEQDLQQAQAQHDAADSQQMTSFISALDAASQSPDAALALYQNAGGDLPDPTPVSKHYAYETPTEKSDREAADQQKLTVFATVVQIHCGMMKNAALVLSKPNDPKVQADWLAWLKSTATIYPQLAGKLPLKNVTMKDSVIGKYLGFHGWGQSDQGTWTILELPSLYKQLVLEPLRNPPTPGVIEAWNVYIAMVQSDDPDPTHFTQSTEPALDFDRAADDFALRPTMDKLQLVDQIIKANPTNDHVDNWITRARQMIETYAGGGTTHSPLPGATPGTTDSSTGGTTPTATPGTTSSGNSAPTPTASPGASSAGTTAPTPMASPGAPYAGTTASTPGATPGVTSSGTTSTTPMASPGTTSAGSSAPIPTASPGTTSAGGAAPLPTASPGTPSSGGSSPTPTATP
jgi:hypothetical protein